MVLRLTISVGVDAHIDPYKLALTIQDRPGGRSLQKAVSVPPTTIYLCGNLHNGAV